MACWFTYHALWQLGFLYDYKFLEILTQNNLPELIKHNNTKEIKAAFKDYSDQDIGIRIYMDLFYAGLAALAGVLISFFISMLLSRKHKWFLVNSLIVLLGSLGMFCLDRFYWYHFRFVFMFDKLFKTLWSYNLASGLLLFAIGLCLFFLKPIIRFIEGKKALKPTLNTEGQVSDYELEV